MTRELTHQELRFAAAVRELREAEQLRAEAALELTLLQAGVGWSPSLKSRALASASLRAIHRAAAGSGAIQEKSRAT